MTVTTEVQLREICCPLLQLPWMRHAGAGGVDSSVLLKGSKDAGCKSNQSPFCSVCWWVAWRFLAYTLVAIASKRSCPNRVSGAARNLASLRSLSRHSLNICQFSKQILRLVLSIVCVFGSIIPAPSAAVMGRRLTQNPIPQIVTKWHFKWCKVVKINAID